MHGVHYIRSSALGQIVQLANHGSVLELALVVRGGIKVMMKKSLSTHGIGFGVVLGPRRTSLIIC